jgi:hypothetical protein
LWLASSWWLPWEFWHTPGLKLATRTVPQLRLRATALLQEEAVASEAAVDLAADSEEEMAEVAAVDLLEVMEAVAAADSAVDLVEDSEVDSEAMVEAVVVDSEEEAL